MFINIFIGDTLHWIFEANKTLRSFEMFVWSLCINVYMSIKQQRQWQRQRRQQKKNNKAVLHCVIKSRGEKMKSRIFFFIYIALSLSVVATKGFENSKISYKIIRPVLLFLSFLFHPISHVSPNPLSEIDFMSKYRILLLFFFHWNCGIIFLRSNVVRTPQHWLNKHTIK